MSERVKGIRTPIRLEFEHRTGDATTRFLYGMADGKILGQRCVECGRVYVPPRGSCPRCAVVTDAEVEVSDKGTVTTFCIVRVPAENLSFDPPFVCAHILLDGADIPMFHVLDGFPLDEARMGMRVQAEWVPEAERTASFHSIRAFRPIDEPDAPFDSFKDHL